MFRKSLYAAAIGGLVFLTGCGGGSSSNPSNPPSNPPPGSGGNGDVVVERVEGPLDPAQEEISKSLLGPLAEAVAGTPLEGVVRCVDNVVTYDTLDVADFLLVNLQNGAQQFNPDPEAFAATLQSLAVDLQGLLEALAGDAQACLASSLPAGDIGDGNPLAGTPLAPLGEQLAPVLAQIVTLTGGGSGGGSGSGVQLSTVQALFGQLYAAVQVGLSQIPQEAYDAPIVGSALSTLQTALFDTHELVNAALAYNAAQTTVAMQNLVDNTLVNLLTNVVPLSLLEEQAGQQGVITGQIAAGSAQIAALVASTLGTATAPLFEQLASGALDPVLGPVDDLLQTLLGPLSDALAGGGSGGGTGGPLAGTPLAPVVNIVTGVLESLIPTGSGGTGDSCPFAGLPLLGALCGLTGG